MDCLLLFYSLCVSMFHFTFHSLYCLSYSGDMLRVYAGSIRWCCSIWVFSSAVCISCWCYTVAEDHHSAGPSSLSIPWWWCRHLQSGPSSVVLRPHAGIYFFFPPWKAYWVFSNGTVMSSTQAVLVLLLMYTMSGLSSMFSYCLLTATSQSCMGRAVTIRSWMLLCWCCHAAECILQWRSTWGRVSLLYPNLLVALSGMQSSLALWMKCQLQSHFLGSGCWFRSLWSNGQSSRSGFWSIVFVYFSWWLCLSCLTMVCLVVSWSSVFLL